MSTQVQQHKAVGRYDLNQLNDAEKTIKEQQMMIVGLHKEFKNKDDSRYKGQQHQRSRGPHNRAAKPNSWSNY